MKLVRKWRKNIIFFSKRVEFSCIYSQFIFDGKEFNTYFEEILIEKNYKLFDQIKRKYFFKIEINFGI